MESPNYKQLVLSNGNELVVEVVDDSTSNIVVRNAVKIAEIYDDEGDVKYVFKPFMAFLDSPDDIIIIKEHSIIGMANPITGLISQYITMTEMPKEEESLEDEEDYGPALGTVH